MIGRVFRIVRTPITLLILLGVLLYGAWWGTLVHDAKAAVERSAARYVQAVQGRLPPPS